MTLTYCDSFDHYVTADMDEKGWGISGVTISASNGRFGASLRSTATTFWAERPRPAAIATGGLGLAYRYGVALTSITSPIWIAYDGAVIHLHVYVNSAAKIVVARGLFGTVLGTGTTTLNLGTFYYIEIKATINDSTGSVVVKVNGNTELNLTSQDTRNGGNATWDKDRFGWDGQGNGTQIDIDDLVLWDTSGSVNNDFMGDVRVEALFPNGNGNSSQLDGSDANQTDNYLLVDETAPNADTDYVESSDVGDKDTYAYTNLTPTAGSVLAVQIVPYAKKTDAGVRSIATVARHSGTEVDSANLTLATNYAYYPNVRETKPGGGAWSISDVNGAEFGVKVTE